MIIIKLTVITMKLMLMIMRSSNDGQTYLAMIKTMMTIKLTVMITRSTIDDHTCLPDRLQRILPHSVMLN